VTEDHNGGAHGRHGHEESHTHGLPTHKGHMQTRAPTDIKPSAHRPHPQYHAKRNHHRDCFHLRKEGNRLKYADWKTATQHWAEIPAARRRKTTEIGYDGDGTPHLKIEGPPEIGCAGLYPECQASQCGSCCNSDRPPHILAKAHIIATQS
jgi:hypothetical protein